MNSESSCQWASAGYACVYEPDISETLRAVAVSSLWRLTVYNRCEADVLLVLLYHRTMRYRFPRPTDRLTSIIQTPRSFDQSNERIVFPDDDERSVRRERVSKERGTKRVEVSCHKE